MPVHPFGEGGNVIGPGASTLYAIPRWGNVDGTELKNSDVIIDDSNNVSGIGTIATGTLTLTTGGVGSGNLSAIFSTDGTGLTITSNAPNSQITLTPTGSGSVVVNGDLSTSGDFSTSQITISGTGGNIDATIYTTSVALVLNAANGTGEIHAIVDTLFEADVFIDGDLSFEFPGSSFSISRNTPAQAAAGTAQLSGGACTVPTTAATGNYTVWITPITAGGGSITGAYTIAKDVGSFDVIAVEPTDDFNFDWEIHYYTT